MKRFTKYERKDPHPHLPFEERDDPDWLIALVMLATALLLWFAVEL